MKSDLWGIWEPLPSTMKAEAEDAIARAGYLQKDFVLAGETVKDGGAPETILVVRARTERNKAYPRGADSEWVQEFEKDLRSGTFGPP